ncbi:hypothetical protein JD844_019862 [Phrynosoma platyrhinos]|uniref:Parvalbumin n=1 Tax=Phrynosoma platyrhinos TaxID=52577 RepID=A0ABQ7TQ62_PHRPL|nr:hypothetical protein JD844_019862 [Phrynosoma platyrhinos]
METIKAPQPKTVEQEEKEFCISDLGLEMALAGILTDAEIAAGLASCKDLESFSSKTFFAKSGLHGKSKEQLTQVFAILDQDKSGFIEEDELQSDRSIVVVLSIRNEKGLNTRDKVGSFRSGTLNFDISFSVGAVTRNTLQKWDFKEISESN